MRKLTTVYRGVRPPHGDPVVVTVNGKPLDPMLSLSVRNHSPTGFEWGYGGSGPAQLALAILLDFYGNGRMMTRSGRRIAETFYMGFKFGVVAGWQSDGWQITGAEIERWMNERPDLTDLPR